MNLGVIYITSRMILSDSPCSTYINFKMPIFNYSKDRNSGGLGWLWSLKVIGNRQSTSFYSNHVFTLHRFREKTHQGCIATMRYTERHFCYKLLAKNHQFFLPHAYLVRWLLVTPCFLSRSLASENENP